jgi:hypothetical protein
MRTDGQDFLERLANSSPNTFERGFAKTSKRLKLGASLEGAELNLLYEAAFYASLCNIAFNGLRGCEGEIKPEREFTRIRLEQGFMEARETFFRCRGWKTLNAAAKDSIQRVFLNVSVLEENLAEG